MSDAKQIEPHREARRGATGRSTANSSGEKRREETGVVHGRDAQEQLSRAWQSWWQANQERSSDEWFVQAVERDIAFLSTSDSPRALQHLEQLTGQSFGAESEGSASQTTSQWKAWWQNNKGHRPGQVLISSVLAFSCAKRVQLFLSRSVVLRQKHIRRLAHVGGRFGIERKRVCQLLDRS